MARTIRRVPDPQKWSMQKLQEIDISPYSLHIPKEPGVVFAEKANVELEHAKQEVLRQVRRAPIRRADLDAYGFTEGCPRCDHAVRYGYGRTSQGHSESCRTRIYEAMLESDEGKLRIARMGQRQLEVFTEYQALMERQKALRSQGEQVSVDPERQPGGEVPYEQVAPDMPETVGAPESLRPPDFNLDPRRVVTEVGDKMKYD